MNIHIHRDGETFGPYHIDDARNYFNEGSLLHTDLAFYEGATDWVPLFQVPGFKDASLPPAAVQPPQPTTSAQSSLDPSKLGAYARATLQDGEKAQYVTKLHWFTFFRAAFFSFFVLLFFILPGLGLLGTKVGIFVLLAGLFLLALLWLSPVLNFISSEFVVTDRRVLIKVGFIRRETHELFISKIESIGVEQGLFGRTLGFGLITIRGTGGSQQKFAGITDPLAFRNAVQKIQGEKDR